MGVADGLVAAEAADALDRFADDRGPKVADVHLLGDVGPAVIDQHPSWRGQGLGAGAGIGGQGVGPRRQGRGADREIDEAGAGDLDRLYVRVARQGGGHGGGDLPGVPPGGLGGHQGPVALKVSKVRPIGGRHAPVVGGQAQGGEGGAGRFAQARSQVAHGWAAAPALMSGVFA